MERKKRDILVAAGPDLCETFGVCANCGVPAHDAKQCPRPKNPLAPRGNNQPPQRPCSAPADKPPHATQRAGRGRGMGCSRPAAASSESVPQERQARGDGRADRVEGLTAADAAQRAPDHGGLPRVLCVAEKPSVAKSLAQILSGGRQRTRTNAQGHAPMCKLYDFFYHFSPAKGKCSVTVTSVLGHVHTIDFDGSNHGDPANLYGAACKKVVEDSTAEQGIEHHLV